MALDINLMVGGEAGQGVQSIGFILAKLAARNGYEVFADQDYESRIRGGHNFFRVRICASDVGTLTEKVDLLIALNKDSVLLHSQEMRADGMMIYDNDAVKDLASEGNLLGIPLQTLAKEKAGNKIMSNTVALGAVAYLIALDLDRLKELLLERFGPGETGEKNTIAAQAGFDHAREHFEMTARRVPAGSNGRKMLLNGNEAIVLGALAAGCRFMAGYPMTPVTPILEGMTENATRMKVATLQAEDEIAAMLMAIGASFAGVRAMTATSGGGFNLMVEGLGLAGMTETPLVIVEGQRPGPATGLPTRTEQGDLLFLLHAAHGEFPRVLFAPSTVEENFWLTVKAFNLAEKYQIPVFILTDHHMATSYWTAPKFDLSQVVIDHGRIYSPGVPVDGDYRRHLLSEDGISPRAFPGTKGIVVFTAGDEHDEHGHIIEDAGMRAAMVEKRLRKTDLVRQEIAAPKTYGPEKADITLLGWGSTFGAIREAVDRLCHEGMNVNCCHFAEIWPFPVGAVEEVLAKGNRKYMVENNATGQMAQLLRAQTCIRVDGCILKYDGRPISPRFIVDQLKKEVGAVW